MAARAKNRNTLTDLHRLKKLQLMFSLSYQKACSCFILNVHFGRHVFVTKTSPIFFLFVNLNLLNAKCKQQWKFVFATCVKISQSALPVYCLLLNFCFLAHLAFTARVSYCDQSLSSTCMCVRLAIYPHFFKQHLFLPHMAPHMANCKQTLQNDPFANSFHYFQKLKTI